MLNFRFLSQSWRRAATLLAALGALALLPGAAAATTVRLQTPLGTIEIELFDSAAPRTVANFLAYVNSGAYQRSFFHRSVPGFVLQGGGYTWDAAAGTARRIPAAAPVANEFSPERSNVRGTVAMAKIEGNPDSATSEWFINLADNSANLDAQNGGFTVFGRVTGNGMAVVDAIAGLRRANAGGAFTSMPLLSWPANGQIGQEHLVLVSSATALVPETERLFGYLESAYAEFLAPASVAGITAASSPSMSLDGYYFRHYPALNAYVGTRNGRLLYLGPASGHSVLDLGPVSDWVAIAGRAGF